MALMDAGEKKMALMEVLFGFFLLLNAKIFHYGDMCSPDFHLVHYSAPETIRSNFKKTQGYSAKEIPSFTRRFSSKEILSFTSNFASKIGFGAVGDVYKGQSPDCLEVAVTVLNANDVDKTTFMNEVSRISKIRHRNLMQLYGFCSDRDMRALVCEYTENGSLYSVLNKKKSGIQFAKLSRTAVHMARGISYLHEELGKPNTHHDFTSANIFLDKNLSPKVPSYGLGKFVKNRNLPIVSRHYTAPEVYSSSIGVSSRCDVYSFGMILFEIARTIADGNGNNWFPEIACDDFEIGDKRKARILSTVALWCVQFTPETRPSISTVTMVLKKEILVNLPPNPFLPTDPLKSIMQPVQESKEVSSSRVDMSLNMKSTQEQPSKQTSNASYSVGMLLRELLFEESMRYSSNELAKFTSNFDNEIGCGAFGTVYKGQLPDGTKMAVKVLKMHASVQQSFLTEIRTTGKTNHKNLIKLFGFCLEENMLALVYEYMENGSLDMILYKKPLTIEWGKLYAIAVELANALAYLHHDCEDQIIHHDIKASNVLLDSNHSPRLADFGLANLKNRETSHLTMSKIKGTPGYTAPEIWTPFSPITYKCDVYSFGMILFEILGMERNTHTDIWFPGHVWEKFNSGELDNVINERGIGEKDRKKATILSMVALWCAQFTPKTRPSMSTVATMLQNEISVNRPPNPLLSSDSSTIMQPAQNSL